MKATLNIVFLFIVLLVNHVNAQTDSLHKRVAYISVSAGYEFNLNNAKGTTVAMNQQLVTAPPTIEGPINFYAKNSPYFSIEGLEPINNSKIAIPFSLSYSEPWFDLKNFITTLNTNNDFDYYGEISAGRYAIYSLMTGADFSAYQQGPLTIELKLMAGLSFVTEPQVNYTYYNSYAQYYNNGQTPNPDQSFSQTSAAGPVLSAGLSLGYTISKHIAIVLNSNLVISYFSLPTSENGAGMIDFHSYAGIEYSLGK